MLEPEIKEIIKQNQETLESLDERVSKIQSKMRWQTVGNVIKTIFILGPVIVGIIYLSPYVKQYVGYLEPALKALKLTPENSIIEIKNPNGDRVISTDDAIQKICDPKTRDIVIEQICNNK